MSAALFKKKHYSEINVRFFIKYHGGVPLKFQWVFLPRIFLGVPRDDIIPPVVIRVDLGQSTIDCPALSRPSLQHQVIAETEHRLETDSFSLCFFLPFADGKVVELCPGDFPLPDLLLGVGIVRHRHHTLTPLPVFSLSNAPCYDLSKTCPNFLRQSTWQWQCILPGLVVLRLRVGIGCCCGLKQFSFRVDKLGFLILQGNLLFL